MSHSLYERVGERKYAFFGVFFVIFFLSYLTLLAVDFVPEAPAESEETAFATSEMEVAQTDTPVSAGAVGLLSETAQPTSLYIKKLNRTVKVLNPESRAVSDLDNALLSGVVRHPDSALVGEAGNVLILGHSSYLPTVINKNFQAFNGIQDLAWGDTIELRTADTVVVYQVEKVYQAKAEEVTVPTGGDGVLLTLATCDSFGSKSDRFIVEAKAVETRQL